MGRRLRIYTSCRKFILVTAIFIVASELIGCGGGSSSTAPAAASIKLSPTVGSLNLGGTLQFSSVALNSINQGILATITYQSSNPAVLSLSPNGLACAGTWDSTFAICSPGQTGTVEVTATAGTTVSAAAKVFVHPQVTAITLSALTVPTTPCLSITGTQKVQATVFSNGTDITAQVGPITWQATDPTVAHVSTTAAGLQRNQAQFTANIPGLTHIFASVSGVTSQSLNFKTCAVQSILLSEVNSGSTSAQVAKGTNIALKATVTDSLGNTISLPAGALNWLTSNNAVAPVRAGTVSTTNTGGAGITASCTPPTCNTNLFPVFSSNVFAVKVTGTPGSSTVYATSTDCQSGCVPTIVPIANNVAGTAVTLPSTPNSILVSPRGDNLYLGSGLGLIVFTPANNTLAGTASAVVGKVLAVSPDGNRVVVSNTTASFNLVNIFNRTTGAVTQLPISGVRAAAFSPDGSKLFMVSPTNLYIFSTLQALKIIALGGPATDAAFLTTGAFGFVGNGTNSAVLPFATCNDAPASGIATSGPLTQIAAVPTRLEMLAVNSPGISSIPISTNGAGCAPSFGTSGATFHDFGQGNFTATQLLVSSDGARAYVIGNLSSVLVYDVASGGVSAIGLAGGASTLSGALTVDGKSLYVGGSDGAVHRLDTTAGTDAQRIPVTLCTGTTTCKPNLVAVIP